LYSIVTISSTTRVDLLTTCHYYGAIKRENREWEKERTTIIMMITKCVTLLTPFWLNLLQYKFIIPMTSFGCGKCFSPHTIHLTSYRARDTYFHLWVKSWWIESLVITQMINLFLAALISQLQLNYSSTISQLQLFLSYTFS